MAAPLHTVAETSPYLRDAKAAGVSEAEQETIIATVSANPEAGDEVVGSGGVRKVRIAGKGKGKSGGYRIMVAFVGSEVPAYILSLLSKGDRETFTDDEIKQMRKVTTAIKSYWAQRKKR